MSIEGALAWRDTRLAPSPCQAGADQLRPIQPPTFTMPARRVRHSAGSARIAANEPLTPIASIVHTKKNAHLVARGPALATLDERDFVIRG